jgi:short-subunit dehydrogenase
MPFALVTGASVGIGRELARECALDGYDLILTARSQQQLETVASELRRDTGRTVVVISVDLAVPGAAAKLFEEVQRQAFKVDVLINNAGFGLVGPFWDLDADRQSQMIHLNVTALTDLSRQFGAEMVRSRLGYIMNVASTAAFQPGPLMSVYYASKAYVLSFSVALANEAKEAGVKVSCLCPGPTATEFAVRSGATKTKLFHSGANVMSAAEVARLGYRALKAGKPICVTGRLNALMAFLTRFAPIPFTAAMARRVQEG